MTTTAKLFATLAIAATLTACGTSAATPAFTPPKGATEVETGVWAKDGMLYGADCDRLRAITNEDGPGIASYGFVCPTP